ncbi:MAG: TVP38/TMEM64 family protein [Oligoflexus sp.]
MAFLWLFPGRNETLKASKWNRCRGVIAMGSKVGKFLIVAVILAVVLAFFAFGWHEYLSLEQLKERREEFATYYENHTILTISIYLLLYIVVTALSLPGATIFTLAGGALFGLMTGTILVSFASTIGASLAFLVARYLLKDSIQTKFGDKLHSINQRLSEEGAFYLFTLRLIPAFPFFIINLVMGLTPMRVWTFAFVSQIGMLPATIVYVNAGTQLGQLTSLSGILSPSLLLSFALIGVFPILAKKIVELIRRSPRSES